MTAGQRLIDLEPNWVGAGGEGITNAQGQPVPHREGVGLMFRCPCGCAQPCFIPIDNPLDGGPPLDGRAVWHRTGETFETLTLTPSIKRARDHGGCGWHGWITAGVVTGQVEP